MARYLEDFTPRLRSKQRNKQCGTLSLGNDKLMWHSWAENQNTHKFYI